MKTCYPLLMILCLQILQLQAQQLITAVPNFPIDLDQCTITFNAALGSGGLANYTGDVYAHTGVITNLSVNDGDWKYVKTNWGQNTPETKLTQTGADTYQLSLSPNIRAYYGVPESEEILKMAFVFRSAAQVGGVWLEGKTDTGGDIFYDVSQSSFNVSILSPNTSPYIVEMGDMVNVSVASSAASNINLFLNEQLIANTSNQTLNTSIDTDDLLSLGNYQLVAVAQNANGDELSDTATFFIRPTVSIEDLPNGVHKNGITYIDDHTAALVLYAPNKSNVFVVGDFNNWQPTLTHYLKKTPNGNQWWVILNNLNAGEEYAYQYLIDGNLRVADPYCHKVLDPWNDAYIDSNTYPNLKPYPANGAQGIVSVLQTAQTPYIWQSNNFVAPAASEMLIYELLVRDFTNAHNYQSLLDTLNYLETLGINTIELMPVTEFEGNISWGYNISFGMALDKYYGTPQSLKILIDECHTRGIAVLLDAVFNHHFGQSPFAQLYWDAANNRPAADNPWLNPIAKHEFNVGYDFNHESPATRQYVTDALRYWLAEYHFDGFRFDLSKGFTQNNTLGNLNAWGAYDQSRINIWLALRDSVHNQYPNARLILEHFANDTEEAILADAGFMLWGNVNYAYNEATMGWNNTSDISRINYHNHNFSQPNLVGYMESHDEERLMYKNISYGNATNNTHNCRDLNTALKRMELANVFFLTVPGPKMIWQFGELGYDYSINYDCRLCPKPIRWDYANNANRYHLYQTIASLNHLRNNYDLFQTTDFTLNGSSALKRIHLNGNNMKATILGNFDIAAANINPNFQETGKWYEFFSGDSLDVNNTNDNIMLQVGEYRLYTTQRLNTPDILPVSIQNIATQDNSKPLLYQIYPNPITNKHCNIAIDLPQTELIRIDLINNTGQIITKLYEGQLPQGKNIIPCNLNHNKHQNIPIGNYWCILQTQSGRYDMLPLIILE